MKDGIRQFIQNKLLTSLMLTKIINDKSCTRHEIGGNMKKILLILVVLCSINQSIGSTIDDETKLTNAFNILFDVDASSNKNNAFAFLEIYTIQHHHKRKVNIRITC